MKHTVTLTFLALLAISGGNPTLKIWEGEVVPIEEMPWMVQFEITGQPLCAGVILSENFILTSATCTSHTTNTFRIRAGTNRYNAGGSVHHVEYIFTHPDYAIYYWQYAVAVAKVNPPFVFDSTRQPVRFGAKNPEIGSNGSVSGWGDTKDDYDSPLLLTQNVTIIAPNDVCEPEGDLEFCGSGAFCDGDWGAPFIQDGLLLGLASLQHFCHDTNTYVSVIAETNWNFIMETAMLDSSHEHPE